MSLRRTAPSSIVLLAVAWVTVYAAGRAPAAPPAPDTKDLVRATLLADAAAVRPGEPFLLGVLLEIRPGWHVYWQNPGDSGLPTRVRLTAPPGFGVGGFRYPVPEKFAQSDGAVAYGYSRSVLLTARVTPPKEAKDMPAAAAFSADVSWLCCEEVCIPGKAGCALEVPAAAGGEARPANQALFASWDRRVPVPAGEKGAAATASVTREPSERGMAFSVVLHWDSMPAQVEFFPALPDALKLSNVEVAPAGAGETRIRFAVEVLKGQKLTATSLPAVVGCRDGQGAWRGVSIDFPLDHSDGR